MKKTLFTALVVAMAACQQGPAEQGESDAAVLSEVETQAMQAFASIDSLLSLDNGGFWNKELLGPIILVDPATRVFYANENNAAQDFNAVSTLFTDTLPPELNIANTAIDWEGKRWSMVMLPLPSDPTERNHLIIHELFHLLQPGIGFQDLQELNNGHLDTYEGRVLLRLELEALAMALQSADSAVRLVHIKNALVLRQQRQSTPDIQRAENSLELNEGLAEYTALMLSGRHDDEKAAHLVQRKDAFYANATFVRSFAYQTLPAYGFLMASAKPGWHREMDQQSNLTAFIREFYGLDAAADHPSLEQLVKRHGYEYPQIEQEESAREQQRVEKVERLKAKFLASPTLVLAFQNMNISFDPRNITPLENAGTVYPNVRVTDAWGILTVEDGALLASDWSKITVTAPAAISDTLVTGEGWQLELAPSWSVGQVDGQFVLLQD